MLGKEDFTVIQALVRCGVYFCDIARDLGVHPKTVSRALKRGGAPSPTRNPRGSVLDPFREGRGPAARGGGLERQGDLPGYPGPGLSGSP